MGAVQSDFVPFGQVTMPRPSYGLVVPGAPILPNFAQFCRRYHNPASKLLRSHAGGGETNQATTAQDDVQTVEEDGQSTLLGSSLREVEAAITQQDATEAYNRSVHSVLVATDESELTKLPELAALIGGVEHVLHRPNDGMDEDGVYKVPNRG